MKLHCVTLTGADDSTDINGLVELSQRYDFVEWGILFSPSKAGRPRFPSEGWLKRMAMTREIRESARLSAHLCGKAVQDLIDDLAEQEKFWFFELDADWLNSNFRRVQMNFNAKRSNLTNKQVDMIASDWQELFDGVLITQDNPANAALNDRLQAQIHSQCGAIRFHDILHDASGGLGKRPGTWPAPIAGVLNGYAGGIGPDNVIETLEALEQIVGRGHIWIDMEASLRDAEDAFDLPAIDRMLQEIESTGRTRGWI